MSGGGRLLRAAGLEYLRGFDPEDVADENTKQLLPLLVEAAGHFLGSGGVVSLQEYCELSRVERVAMSAAGKRRDVELAVRAAKASQGDAGLALVAAEVDGGEAHDEMMLAAAVSAIAKRKYEVAA